jgi:hypothetical protein
MLRSAKNRFSVGWFVGIILLNLLGTALLGLMAFAAAWRAFYGGPSHADGCLVFWPYWTWTARNYYLMGVPGRNNRRLRDAEDYRTR